ncbi:hypothetical protein ACA910_010913 [Epithemia clementina (nom. ined.)]
MGALNTATTTTSSDPPNKNDDHSRHPRSHTAQQTEAASSATTAPTRDAANPPSSNQDENKNANDDKENENDCSTIHDGTERQRKSNNSNTNHSHDKEASSSSSLSDQVLASALAGTVGFLKLAGGLTLTATGKVVAPPLHITRTVVLPQLWAATVDAVSQATPQRLKDWLRILQLAVVQFISVLRHTERGLEFRQCLLLFLDDLLDCISSDATRQVVVDVTASVVQLGQALYTPEMQQFSIQATITACRILEAANSGRVQQALLDGQELLWATLALWADPETMAAVAEVTAYLCYALEMENAILDGSAAVSSSSHSQTKQQRRQRQLHRHQQRRKNRGIFQKTTYQDRILLRNPNTTVEEAILSSLGVMDSSTTNHHKHHHSRTSINKSKNRKNNNTEQHTHSSSASQSSSANKTETGQLESISGQELQQPKQQQQQQPEAHKDVEQRLQLNPETPATASAATNWDDLARKDVNVIYMRDQITQRLPPPRVRQPQQERTSDGTRCRTPNLEEEKANGNTNVPDVEDGPPGGDDDDNNGKDDRQMPLQRKQRTQTQSKWISMRSKSKCSPSRRKRQRTRIDVVATDSTKPMGHDENDFLAAKRDSEPTTTNDHNNDNNTKESPTAQYFTHVLNEILAQKRAQGVHRVLQKTVDQAERSKSKSTNNNNNDSEDASFLSSFWTRPGRVQTSSSEENHLDSIRQRLNALRDELAKQQQQQQQQSSSPSSTKSRSIPLQPPQSPLGTTLGAGALSRIQRHRVWLLLLLLAMVLTATAGFGLACYGLYALVYRPQPHSAPPYRMADHALPPPPPQQPQPQPQQPQPQQELVIRIVRQVVHVDHQGRVLDPADLENPKAAKLAEQSVTSEEETKQQLDQIANCVSAAMDAMNEGLE